MFITKRSLSRRTMLRGMGATLALPFLDAMVPAATALAKTAAQPVLRGKWVLENIIGVSPAPPPDVVPALDEVERPDKPRSVRESLTVTRRN